MAIVLQPSGFPKTPAPDTVVLDSVFLGSPRKTYYCEKVDPGNQVQRVFEELKGINREHHESHIQFRVTQEEYQDPKLQDSEPGLGPNLISSLCEDGLHRPVFDWDHPEVDRKFIADFFGMDKICNIPGFPYWELVMAIPSTTNWHIYIPWIALTWEIYIKKLSRLATMTTNGENMVEGSSGWEFWTLGTMGRRQVNKKIYDVKTDKIIETSEPYRVQVLADGYVGASKTQKQTCVRVPYIKKPLVPTNDVDEDAVVMPITADMMF